MPSSQATSHTGVATGVPSLRKVVSDTYRRWLRGCVTALIVAHAGPAVDASAGEPLRDRR
jgi:hypothetical protein